MNNFQRIGSVSNSHVGRDFEKDALNYFQSKGIVLSKSFSLPIGVGSLKKDHVFDLGCNSPQYGKIIVECKSHTWTSGGNIPSAKLTVWNEAMYYFLLASNEYRKILFVLKNYSDKRGETLGEYYVRTHKHLIPDDVEIMEYDPTTNTARILN
jgi:hypothetical protein